MTIIESEQSREISLTEISRGPFVLRFASYRKSEDAKLNLRSEDYIVSELTPDSAMFGLCDGVGSSFYGDIGSQILGETILNWLKRVPLPKNLILEKNNDSSKWLETLTNDLQTELNSKINLATNIIQKKEITSKDELIRLAENTQRDDFGTQSNFACGILWPRSPSLPNGLIILFWLGNARLRIFNKNKDLTNYLGWGDNPNQLKEVWSSKEGVVGSVYSYLTDFSKITTVMAYSDGLENVEENIHPNLNGTQFEAIVNQAQLIKDDDVSYLELSAIQGEVAGGTDDIVSLLRNPVVSASVKSEPELQKLKQALASLQNKYNTQSLGIKKIKLTLIALSIILSTLCLLAGFLLGSVLSSKPELAATPTPSATLIPPPFHLPEKPRPHTNADIIPTLTITVTPILTMNPTDSETLTPTSTYTPGP
jgi:hypothetical protein